VAIQTIDLSTPNSGAGTPLRDGGQIINDNFAELDARAGSIVTAEASEALSAFHAINRFGSGGSLALRKANATDDTKPCDGFVIAAVGLGDQGDSYSLGATISGFPAATFVPGTRYYLSTAGGGITDTPPAGSGNLIQEIGQAETDTKIVTYRGPMVTLA
jgi:hypothetical protein